MNRWTYYSPLALGALFGLLARDFYEHLLPGEPWQAVATVTGIAIGFGLLAQLALVGVQGAFAQVMPVPGGRSIRGRAAVVIGALLLAALVGGIVAAILYGEGLGEEGLLPTVALLIAILAAAAAIGAAGVYAWSWPAAERDFATERPALSSGPP
jgi:hypothetical protein